MPLKRKRRKHCIEHCNILRYVPISNYKPHFIPRRCLPKGKKIVIRCSSPNCKTKSRGDDVFVWNKNCNNAHGNNPVCKCNQSTMTRNDLVRQSCRDGDGDCRKRLKFSNGQGRRSVEKKHDSDNHDGVLSRRHGVYGRIVGRKVSETTTRTV